MTSLVKIPIYNYNSISSFSRSAMSGDLLSVYTWRNTEVAVFSIVSVVSLNSLEGLLS